MRTRQSGARPGTRLVRPSWMLKLMAACQHFVLDVEATSHDPEGDPTKNLLAALPASRSRVEELLHRVALARLAADYTLRRRGRSSRRHGLPESITRILLDDSHPPAKAFEDWSRRTFRPGTLHVGLAERAGAIIRAERSAAGLNLRPMARALRCSERDLRVAFQRTYGMSPRRFHSTVRALRGVDVLLADPTKISEVAKDLGFKSPKNFYHLIEEITELTPRQLRALSPSQAEQLRRRLRDSLKLPETD